MNLHHRDGKPWDPARYNPDDSDTWKCNGLGADCGYSHTGTVSYHYACGTGGQVAERQIGRTA